MEPGDRSEAARELGRSWVTHTGAAGSVSAGPTAGTTKIGKLAVPDWGAPAAGTASQPARATKRAVAGSPAAAAKRSASPAAPAQASRARGSLKHRKRRQSKLTEQLPLDDGSAADGQEAAAAAAAAAAARLSDGDVAASAVVGKRAKNKKRKRASMTEGAETAAATQPDVKPPTKKTKKKKEKENRQASQPAAVAEAEVESPQAEVGSGKKKNKNKYAHLAAAAAAEGGSRGGKKNKNKYAHLAAASAAVKAAAPPAEAPAPPVPKQARPEGEPAAISATRARLETLYSEHNPGNLAQLDTLIAKYGAHQLLMKAASKYHVPNMARGLDPTEHDEFDARSAGTAAEAEDSGSDDDSSDDGSDDVPTEAVAARRWKPGEGLPFAGAGTGPLAALTARAAQVAGDAVPAAQSSKKRTKADPAPASKKTLGSLSVSKMSAAGKGKVRALESLSVVDVGRCVAAAGFGELEGTLVEDEVDGNAIGLCDDEYLLAAGLKDLSRRIGFIELVEGWAEDGAPPPPTGGGPAPVERAKVVAVTGGRSLWEPAEIVAEEVAEEMEPVRDAIAAAERLKKLRQNASNVEGMKLNGQGKKKLKAMRAEIFKLEGQLGLGGKSDAPTDYGFFVKDKDAGKQRAAGELSGDQLRQLAKVKRLQQQKAQAAKQQKAKPEAVKKKQPEEKKKAKKKGKYDKENLLQKLSGGRFRFLNEMLYTEKGGVAFEKFQDDPGLFDVYHDGFRAQVGTALSTSH